MISKFQRSNVCGHLVQEDREELFKFLHFQLSHKKREGNAVAHKLARMSKEFIGLNIGIEELPVWLNDLLNEDVSHFVVFY